MADERYVPVSKLQKWLHNWGTTLFGGPRADMQDLLDSALTPSAMTLEMLRECLERAGLPGPDEELGIFDHGRDQRPSEVPETRRTGQ